MKETHQVVVSVLMSVYNEDFNWITEAVNSILNQTIKDIEFIIVNDNPQYTDLHNFLEELSTSNRCIKIILNDKNRGLAYSMNRALEIADGKYIARMDADDIALPTRFEKQIDFLEKNKDISIVGSQIKMFGKSKKFWINLSTPQEIKAKLIFKSCLAHPSVLIRTEDVKKYNLFYDESLCSTQDYDLWTRAALVTKLANIDEVLLLYRVHNKQVSSLKKKQQEDNFNEINLRYLTAIIGPLSEEESQISKYLWKYKSFNNNEEQSIFKAFILKIIEKNDVHHCINYKELYLPLINTLIKKQYKKEFSNYILLTKYLLKVGIVYHFNRKKRKSALKKHTHNRYTLYEASKSN
ncbi:glycosyltransferase [Prolixibacteraceae bacterium]|nr:glycosyltransferase [Prolixibacteraceae bacterium]